MTTIGTDARSPDQRVPAGAGLDTLRALAHPLRVRLLSLLTGESLSAAEAARRLGDTQANVSYHLRRLADVGLVDLVEEVAVRGGTAKRYRHNPASAESLRLTDSAGVTALMVTLARELNRRAAEYRDRAEIAFTDAEVWVSEPTRVRAVGLARQLGELLHDEALPAGPEAVRLSATVALFELRPAPGSTP